MNVLEQVYFQGQIDYENAMIGETLAAEEELALAAESGSLDEELATREALVAKEAYMLGMEDYEAALLASSAAAEEEVALGYEEDILSAYEAGAADYEDALVSEQVESGALEGELVKEEAYQMGVALAEARQLVKELEASAKDMDKDLHEFFDKGIADVNAALQFEEKLSESKPKGGEAAKRE